MHLYPIYLKEVNKHDWSIEVDKELFDELSYAIVDKNLIALYEKIDFKSDTTILAGNRIGEKYAGEHCKAIEYVLLKQGINCCQDCETGVIIVGSDR